MKFYIRKIVKITMSTTVVRIRRKGDKIVQNCDIYIGRKCTMGGWNLPQSKWANPFKILDINDEKERDEVLEKYRKYITKNEKLMKELPELKGKVLGCFCKPKKCHGDILVELVEK